MPVCPKCHQEYDEGIKECADCLVPLGETEAGPTVPEAEAGPLQAAVFRAETAEVLDLMMRAVALHHVPMETREEVPGIDKKGHFLLVPIELGPKVAGIFDRGLPMLIGEGEGKDRVYRLYETGKHEEIRDPELLRQSTSALVEQGDAVIDELIEIVTRGDQAARHRAAFVLSCMGENGTVALIKLLKVAIEKAEHDTAISLIRVMRQELEPGQGWEEFVGYLEGPAESKILALQALNVLGTLDVFEKVLPLLDDSDPEVRDEADNTLCTLSEEDMGFDAGAPEEERRASIKEWEAWWAGRRHG
ncbi:MAG: HEAT repeat domain-containing protein [Planctomycetota bacterium]|jgi:hypothetical protein